MKKLYGKWGMSLDWTNLMMLIAIILVLVEVLIVPVPVMAEYYKYIDKNGTAVFTDDLSKVPEAERAKAQQSGDKGYQNHRDNNTAPTETYSSENKLNEDRDREKVDALLKSKWEGLMDSLSKRDITTALTYISSGSRASYEEMYKALYDQLPAITATHREFNLVYIQDNVAKYKLVTFENNKYYSHEVTFVKDADGTWKIFQY